jgi:hypothetical protein
MQENLENLFATQEIESEMINKTTKFIKVAFWICNVVNGYGRGYLQMMSQKIFLNCFYKYF